VDNTAAFPGSYQERLIARAFAPHRAVPLALRAVDLRQPEAHWWIIHTPQSMAESQASIGAFSPRWTEMIYPAILATGEPDGRQWSAAGEELRRCTR
jgi:hypothetical protein